MRWCRTWLERAVVIRLPGRIALWLLFLLPVAAMAQLTVPVYPGGYKGDFEEDKPWEEQKATLPPYPQVDNLVRVYISAATTFEFFVDLVSVNVGRDGVVRYTLIARSPSGATNVSFEGLRCASRERRLYAFGRPGDIWTQARKAEWVPIFGDQPNRQHATLAEDFFCQGRTSVASTQEAVRALKRGGHPANRSIDLQSQPR